MGRPGVLQSMRLQRVRHDLVTEQQQLGCLWLIVLTRDLSWCVVHLSAKVNFNEKDSGRFVGSYGLVSLLSF